MQKPATVLRKWCESEKPIEPPLARLSCGPKYTRRWQIVTRDQTSWRSTSLATSVGRATGGVEQQLGVEAAQPRELALGQPARVAGHRLRVAAPGAPRSPVPPAPSCSRRRRRPGAPPPRRPRRASPRRAVDRAVERLALHRQPAQQRRVAQARGPQPRVLAPRCRLLAHLQQLERADQAGAVAGRHLRRPRRARARRSSSCRACAPSASRRASMLSRRPSGGGGRSSRSVSAAWR